MNIHEFQAKQVLQKYGIPVPPFFVVSNMEQAQKVVESSSIKQAVVKVQVHAGGRGKAGGVKFASTPQEILQYANELIGKKIVNHQTGHEGMVSHQVLITAPVEIIKEFYLGIVIDRQQAQGMLIASPEGGMEIEEVAKNSPDKVLKFPIPLSGKLHSHQLLNICKFMGWTEDLFQQGKAIITALIKAFVETDASLLEINPLVLTNEGKLIALDAKLSVDDNALFRQPEIKSFFDETQVPLLEAKAQQYELAYVALEGNVGCMVNGAGLAMATMDIIHHYGGAPANFLDVGGGASKEKVAEGFKIILSDQHVKAILVNIFGGIMNCETLALGIIEAAKDLRIHVPLVVRMEGTNVEEGKRLLKEAKLNIIIANTLTEAAQKVVSIAKQET